MSLNRISAYPDYGEGISYDFAAVDMFERPVEPEGGEGGGGTHPWRTTYEVTATAGGTVTEAIANVQLGRIYKSWPLNPFIGAGISYNGPPKDSDGIIQSAIPQSRRNSSCIMFIELTSVLATDDAPASQSFNIGSIAAVDFNDDNTPPIEYIPNQSEPTSIIQRYPISLYLLDAVGEQVAFNNYYVTTVCINGLPVPSLTPV